MTESNTNKRVVVKTIDYPHKISLYHNPPSRNLYYYFTWKKQSYRGSTGSENEEISISRSIETFYDIKRGRRPKVSQSNTKLKDVCKKFLKFKKEKEMITERTLMDYTTQSKYLLEYFKDKDVHNLCSKKEYEKYSEWRKEYYNNDETKRKQRYKKYGRNVEGRKYITVGNVKINRECRLLVSILRFAKDHLNLLQNVSVPPYTMLPENHKDELLTHEEYERLKEYWTRKNPYYWMIISFVNNTGIRYPSELNRIVWGDVHLDKSHVLIRDRKTKFKNKKPLHTPVPLVGRSKEIIEFLQSREGIPKGVDDFVFINDTGKQIKNIKKSFKIGLKDCGIEKNLSMYSLRHLFTTRMVKRSDIPLKVLAEVLGHKDTTMLNERYSHLRSEDLVNVFQRSEDRKQEIIRQREELTNEVI